MATETNKHKYAHALSPPPKTLLPPISSCRHGHGCCHQRADDWNRTVQPLRWLAPRQIHKGRVSGTPQCLGWFFFCNMPCMYVCLLTNLTRMSALLYCFFFFVVVVAFNSTPEEIDENLEHWKHVMLFLLAQIGACFVVSSALNVVDARTVRERKEGRGQRGTEERERERDTERQRERERLSHTNTDTQTHRHTDTQTHRHTDPLTLLDTAVAAAASGPCAEPQGRAQRRR